MAKKLVRYLLEGDGTIPLFVANGGYWQIGGELVGVSVDENIRHVPSTVVRMARADIDARIAGMELRNPLTNEVLDSQAKTDLLEVWLAAIEMSDLA